MTSRTVIVHDYFAIRGGGERTALTLAKALDATLMYGYRTAETFEPEMFPARRHDLHFPEYLNYRGLRVLALALAFAISRERVAKYRQRVFSGVVSVFAAPPAGEGGRNILYCHTPPRFLYDLRARYDAEGSLVRRTASQVFKPPFQLAYEVAVARMDVIVANSRNVQARIAHYLGRESVVVYPPCDVDRFAWAGQQGFYLSTARLSDLKRVNMIVEAFLRMPDKRLVVASNGELYADLRAQAGDAANIRFTGWTDDASLRRLVGEAIATIYVPVDEDFGMSPVESMAAGKPCISVAEGGPLESVLAGETGLLLKPSFTTDELVDAVSSLSPMRALAMRAACEARAKLFSRQTFVERMREITGVVPVA